ncbi:hypothetical protein SAMN05421504_105209 [Amycolatopsis xylanica]|uniref:Uncharacterized protein n=1 Tax=Amycolatopsis xylanica TaxID=589385 RepID=A0A1H3J1G1_9PSEU|nr:hypothetical protein [Amycolatopsis xylanica]SDY33771.1 hypothetical protein SAMN05421504_105209 [Amycolatopsis xylanica]
MADEPFVLPKSPTPLELRREFIKAGQPHFNEIRDKFCEVNGDIIEEHYYPDTPAAAILVRSRRERRLFGRRWFTKGAYKLHVNYSSAEATPSFAAALRSARQEEHKNSALLRSRAQEIFAQTIYSVIVHLLGILDLVSREREEASRDLTSQPDLEWLDQRQSQEAEAAEKDITEAKAFATSAVRNSAITFYIIGLPLGVALVTMLIFGLLLVRDLADGQLAVCLAAGAIGALLSVMTRITNNGQVDVAIERTRWMTVLAGAFRPAVGAVFGAAIYVLILGGLIPFKEAVGTGTTFYFTGLAFLAGFSERWAQDTIVQSTPSSAATP